MYVNTYAGITNAANAGIMNYATLYACQSALLPWAAAVTALKTTKRLANACEQEVHFLVDVLK